MNMTLTVFFEEVAESEGGGYIVCVQEMPGTISEGDTLEEAHENLRDAIATLLGPACVSFLKDRTRSSDLCQSARIRCKKKLTS